MRYNNKNNIPLLIRFPESILAGRSSLNVQLIDIAPTILDTLGMPIPDWMEGDSIRSADLVNPDRYIFITGVRYNKAAGKVWIRTNQQDNDFSTSNIFSVVHCDYFMKSTYPISFKPVKLKQSNIDPRCKPKSPIEIAQQAKQLIEAKLGQ